jgi:hypothetical protein
MSNFCTSCGAAITGASFCTSCGVAVGSKKVQNVKVDRSEQPAPSSVQQSPPIREVASLDESTIVKGGKKRVLISITAALLLIGTGAGAFFAGKSSANVEQERKKNFDLGFEAGKKSGNEAGYQSGFTAGKRDGCREAFDFNDGTFDYIVPYNPSSAFNKYPGSYYKGKSGC